MFRGIITTKYSSVEKSHSSFVSILREMEMLKQENINRGIESIDIYEDGRVVAALRLI
jgi:hypothetical protein